MRKNIKDLVGKTLLARHRTREAGVRSLLSLMFSMMLIMSNATPFVQVASAATGDFSIDFAAAAPISYDHSTGGGAWDDKTSNIDVVEQLEGGDFACGDIVTFLVEVAVNNDASPTNQTIDMDFEFSAVTTSGSPVGMTDIVFVQANYGPVQGGDGAGGIDSGMMDDGGSTATLISETLPNPPFVTNALLKGTVRLDDLEPGEKVIVRIDVLLSCQPNEEKITGNLQGKFADERLDNGEGLQGFGGAQTVPFISTADISLPDIDIEKCTNGEDADQPTGPYIPIGETVTWTYNVTNTGNVNLTDINVTDDKIGIVGTIDLLLPGEMETITKTGTAESGQYANNGTAKGYYGQIEVNDTDPSHYYGANSSIDIEKYTNGEDADSAPGPYIPLGETVTWTYNVTNTGNVDLTNVQVYDDELGEVVGTIASLPVGDTQTITKTGIAEPGQYANNGTATGYYGETEVNDTDPSHYFGAAPAYTIDKIITDVAGKGAEASVTNMGDVISYQITVTNTGNVDLTNVEVTDSLIENLDGPVESLSDDGILEVGETWTYTGTYTVTLEDIITNGGGDGFIENTATVDCDQLEPESDSAAAPIEIPVCEFPAYEIEKCITDVDCRGPTASVEEAGDVISYQITVTNTGNVDLTNVEVTDSLIENLEGPVESLNNDGILEVGETWIYTGTYIITLEDIITNGDGDGFIENTATVDCDQLEPKSDSAKVPIETTQVSEPCPAYEIEKCVTDVDCRGSTANVTAAGDVISYRITVTNTGDVDLTNVVVTDPLIETLNGPVESKDTEGVLDIGETWTYTGCYVVTQEDIDNNGKCDEYVNNVEMVNCEEDTESECDGYIDNTATVECDQLDPKSDSVRVLIEKASTEDPTDEDSTDEDPIEVNQDYCISKSIIGVDEAGDCIINEAGDIIEYQIIVKNEGNADLTGVSVSDPMIILTGPAGDEIDPGVLNPGETWKFFGNYAVTQEDINSNGGGDGFIENNATVSCNELPDESSSVKQPIVLSSEEEDNGSNGDNGNDGDNGSDGAGGSDGDTESDGDTGSARVIPKTSKNDEVNENKGKETGSEIELEPEIKNFEQNTETAEADVEKEPVQEDSKGIPGYLIYGLLGLLAILMLLLMSRRKKE